MDYRLVLAWGIGIGFFLFALYLLFIKMNQVLSEQGIDLRKPFGDKPKKVIDVPSHDIQPSKQGDETKST